MSTYVLKDSKVWLGGAEIAQYCNGLTLNASAQELDATTFGNSALVRLSGLIDLSGESEGFVDLATAASDSVLWTNFGQVDRVFSWAPKSGDAGEIGYTFPGVITEYSQGGQVGEMLAFNLAVMGSGGVLVRSTVMENRTVSATGSGTARELGAVGASQKLYAALHVLSASGTSPSLTVKVQSDADSGFASPVDQITFTPATAAGAEWATPVPGAIADTWWRITWTVSGTSPSFQFVVLVGIQ